MSKKKFDKESITNVFRVVIGVSLVCSILVALSAVYLRDRQIANQTLDLKKNVLVAAGSYKKGMSPEEIESEFELIEPIVVDFKKREFTEDIDPVKYDMEKAGKDPETSIGIPADQDIANIRRIPHYGIIYLYKKSGKLEKIILPISGLGLWSTLYGFISLESDGKTVSGINFYDHAETPGLGGEVDNPKWQAKWIGKKIYNEKGDPVIAVVKGAVDNSREGSEHKVDGISGATITARAVGDMVRFWLGDFGYGKFLSQLTDTKKPIQGDNKQ